MKKHGNIASKSEKMTWRRKMKLLEELITKLNPIEDVINEHEAKRIVILDAVVTLRKAMVETCVHPDDMLVVVNETSSLCKFCNATINSV